MKYKEIIRENCENHSSVSWWPKFAYHYTDIQNVVSILSSGYLYSRINAEKLNLMRNDNASRQVIDMTNTATVSCVRFYFRPLTPTQYYNEGFKHQKLRYDNDINADVPVNANVPVPIFLLFDLESLLSMENTLFSEKAQSGNGAPLYHSVEDFQHFNFDEIYNNEYITDHEQIRYRHAEILYPDCFSIDPCLKAILCRNNVERTMLLNLLEEKDKKAFYKYKQIIKVCRTDMFESNGLFVTEMSYHNGVASINFSDSYAKKSYISYMKNKNSVSVLDEIDAKIKFDWVNSRRLLYNKEVKLKLDYENVASISFRGLPFIKDATTIKMEFFMDDKLMCYMVQPISEIELL